MSKSWVQWVWLAALAIVMSACSSPEQPTATTETTAVETKEVALIDRTAIFGNPTRTQARISPDGQWLSWLAPRDGVVNIWVAPADAPDQAKPITADTGRGIPVHFWTANSTEILYLQDKGGNENNHVYAVAITGDQAVRDLTPVADDVSANVTALSRDKPDTVLVSMNERNPQLMDLWEITISTGERTLAMENPGYAAWMVDNNLTPRVGMMPVAGGDLQMMRLDGDSPENIGTIPSEDVLTSQFLGFNKANDVIYMLDSRGRDTAALISIDIATGEQTLIASDERADINQVQMDPTTREPTAYSSNFLRTEWVGLNDADKAMFKNLGQQLQGEIQFVAGTYDGNRLVFHLDNAQSAGAYYMYDRTAEKASLMLNTREDLNDAPLQPMQALELKARDGLTLVSYLTLPPNSDSDADGIPDSALPMVLFVHGGPWARDAYGYSSIHQWLANRGYAVLSVNYRGSTGFGKAFTNAAVGEFAGKMHDDLIDAVDWAVAKGVAAKDQVAIMGGSYGGYATLVGVTFTPDTFACGVDIVGPSSLVTLVESFPAYWAPFLESTWYKYVGNPAEEEDRAVMLSKSPMTRVADIKVPLLIGQGENDPRVTKAESDQLVEAMDARELPVTYLNYPDEGHGFQRPENRMSFFATSEAFLSECLGGRMQGIDGDFEGSSVQVLHGAEYVPGLAEAITPDA